MAFSLYAFLALLSVAALSNAGTLCTRAEMAEENLRKLAMANNDLALNIHRKLAAKTSGNVFFSPFSLSSAFGMLYYGTKGQTAKELRQALGYETANLPEELVHQTFNEYLTENLPSQDPSAYVLDSANAVLLDEHLDVLPSYKKEVQKLYQASVRDVDFSTQAPEVMEEINSWVKEKTHGKIDKLLEELDPTTALVMMNAAYFKGTWKTQFDTKQTEQGEFFNNGEMSELQKVDMMRMKKHFYPYAQMNDFEVLEIPYKGDNISMYIILPTNLNGLQSVEENLTLEKFSTIRSKFLRTKINLAMPKFKLEYSKEVSGEFRAIGAKSIFTPGADFSGVTSSRNLFVNQVLHKAVIEVNEEGSEAAVVTVAMLTRSTGFYKFNVNRPFMFAIVDKRFDMILFMGRVTKL